VVRQSIYYIFRPFWLLFILSKVLRAVNARISVLWVLGFGGLLLDYLDFWAVLAAVQYAKCGKRLKVTSLACGFEL
jgi:hypothetical protein